MRARACSPRVVSSTTTAHISTTPHKTRLTLSKEPAIPAASKSILHTHCASTTHTYTTPRTHTLAQTHTRTANHATMSLHILHFCLPHNTPHNTRNHITSAFSRFLTFTNWFFKIISSPPRWSLIGVVGRETSTICGQREVERRQEGTQDAYLWPQIH